MGRLILSLLAACLVIAACLGSKLWSDRRDEHRQSALRSVRVHLQQLRQQLGVLETPGVRERVQAMPATLEALQIRLVESLEKQAWPSLIEQVNYEMSILTDSPFHGEVGDEPGRVLRLELSLVAGNGIAFLSLLERVDAAVGGWPQETRGCSLQRREPSSLQIACAIDIYHWQPVASVTGRPESNRPEWTG